MESHERPWNEKAGIAFRWSDGDADAGGCAGAREWHEREREAAAVLAAVQSIVNRQRDAHEVAVHSWPASSAKPDRIVP